MTDRAENRVSEAHQTFQAASELAPLVSRTGSYRAKVFKSGNSLALRLPKALGLVEGLEMELLVATDGSYALRRADAPKRKIDVSKFAGKAPWLKPLTAEEREFEHRELDWHLLENPGSRP